MIVTFFDQRQRVERWIRRITTSRGRPAHTHSSCTCGWDTAGDMAGWHRAAAAPSLLRVALLLLLLSAPSSGKAFKKCPGDESCLSSRPPVVLGECFLQLCSVVCCSDALCPVDLLPKYHRNIICISSFLKSSLIVCLSKTLISLSSRTVEFGAKSGRRSTMKRKQLLPQQC